MWVMPIDVWKELPADAEYVLVRPATPSDGLTVRVEGSPAPDLADRVSASIGAPVAVEAIEPGSLPRSAYKSERVVDES
jgi:phenylacetate-coenzyme A ligase PaaK-like adenylate-forming protein